MADVVNLAQFAFERRQREEAEAHARGLVLFECAAALARQENRELLALVHQVFGADWFEARVQETLAPVKKTDAPVHGRTKRAPK